MKRINRKKYIVLLQYFKDEFTYYLVNRKKYEKERLAKKMWSHWSISVIKDFNEIDEAKKYISEHVNLLKEDGINVEIIYDVI